MRHGTPIPSECKSRPVVPLSKVPEWSLPPWAELDEDDNVVAWGDWHPTTAADYWTVVQSESVNVYASRTEPGRVVMTSWCKPDDGVPVVAAVDLWNGDERVPTWFYRFVRADGSGAS